MTINRKIFLALWGIFLVIAEVATAEDMAVISVIMAEKHLRARDPNTNDILCSFDVEVAPDSQRKDDGNFIFSVRLVHVKFQAPAIPEEISFFYNDQPLKIRLEDKYYVSDNFEIVVPANQVSNSKFRFQTGLLVVKRVDINLSTDALQFDIEANLDISLSQTRISLGKLIYENNRIRSLDEPQVTLRYSALCRAECRIDSENDFRLKHTARKFSSSLIPYRLRLQIAGIPDCHVQESKAIPLPIAPSAWTGQAEVFATVNDNMPVMPIQGAYGDRITFSIKPNE
jgi:hypothetical protein